MKGIIKMKKTTGIIILSSLMFLLCSCGAGLSVPETHESEPSVSETGQYSEAYIAPAEKSDSVCLLKDADSSSQSLITLKENDSVQVISLQNQWAYIRFRDLTGYVPVTCIRFQAPEQETTIVSQVSETTPAETTPVSTVAETTAAPRNEHGVYDPEKNYSDFQSYSHAILCHASCSSDYFISADDKSEKAGSFDSNQTVFVWGVTGVYSYVSDESQSSYGYILSSILIDGAYVPPAEENFTAYFSKEEIFASAGVSDVGAHVVGGVVSNLSCDNGDAYTDTEFFFKYDLLKSISVSNAKKGYVSISGDVTIYGVDRYGGEPVSYEMGSGHFSLGKWVE